MGANVGDYFVGKLGVRSGLVEQLIRLHWVIAGMEGARQYLEPQQAVELLGLPFLIESDVIPWSSHSGMSPRWRRP